MRAIFLITSGIIMSGLDKNNFSAPAQAGPPTCVQRALGNIDQSHCQLVKSPDNALENFGKLNFDLV